MGTPKHFGIDRTNVGAVANGANGDYQATRPPAVPDSLPAQIDIQLENVVANTTLTRLRKETVALPATQFEELVDETGPGIPGDLVNDFLAALSVELGPNQTISARINNGSGGGLTFQLITTWNASRTEFQRLAPA